MGRIRIPDELYVVFNEDDGGVFVSDDQEQAQDVAIEQHRIDVNEERNRLDMDEDDDGEVITDSEYDVGVAKMKGHTSGDMITIEGESYEYEMEYDEIIELWKESRKKKFDD